MAEKSDFDDASGSDIDSEEMKKEDCNGLKTMQLNDQKAGMDGLDKDHINKVIYNASKGTSYFNYQQKRQDRINKKVAELKANLKIISESQKKEAKEKMDAFAAHLESERDLSRIIVHIDMDAYYAAVEMRDNPELKDKPMAVGSLSMLSTSNYHARKFGVRAAMPGFIGKKLCPELIIVPVNFHKYRTISDQIREILKEYDPDFLPMSLDEVYLDLTDYVHKKKKTLQEEIDHCKTASLSQSSNSSVNSSENDILEFICKEAEANIDAEYFHDEITEDLEKIAYDTVEEIRDKICRATQLTASAGIAPNMLLAKVCSDLNKPNGQYQLHFNIDDIKTFVSSLPIRKVSGIGPVQGQILNALGIHTCQDLWDKRDEVALLFTPTSSHFYIRVSQGLGSTEIKSDSTRKSKGCEETFKELSSPEELHTKCKELCEEVASDLKSSGLIAKVVVLKIKTVKFEVFTRHFTLLTHTSDADVICKTAKKLLETEIATAGPDLLRLRLMGIRACNLLEEEEISKSDGQQITLKEFLKSKQDKPKKDSLQELTGEEESSNFKCPVCFIILKHESLEEFNNHLDQCLSKNGSLVEAQEDLSLSSEKSEIHEHNGKNATESSSLRLDTCVVLNGKAQSIDVEALVCPVCEKKQRHMNLDQLNEHIDRCLNKGAIKELLSSETSFSQTDKRKRTPPQSQKLKKLKAKPHATKRMEDFFSQTST